MIFYIRIYIILIEQANIKPCRNCDFSDKKALFQQIWDIFNESVFIFHKIEVYLNRIIFKGVL